MATTPRALLNLLEAELKDNIPWWYHLQVCVTCKQQGHIGTVLFSVTLAATQEGLQPRWVGQTPEQEQVWKVRKKPVSINQPEVVSLSPAG